MCTYFKGVSLSVCLRAAQKNLHYIFSVPTWLSICLSLSAKNSHLCVAQDEKCIKYKTFLVCRRTWLWSLYRTKWFLSLLAKTHSFGQSLVLCWYVLLPMMGLGQQDGDDFAYLVLLLQAHIPERGDAYCEKNCNAKKIPCQFNKHHYYANLRFKWKHTNQQKYMCLNELFIIASVLSEWLISLPVPST